MTCDELMPPEGGGRNRRVADVVRVLLLVAAVMLGVVAIAQDRDGFLDAVRSIGAGRAVLALGLTSLGLLAAAEAWREAVRSVAGSLARPDAQRVFFVTQLGKYLPGSVWTVVGQVDSARRHGLSRSRMAVGALLYIGYHVVTGAVVAAVVLPFAVPALAADYPWALLAVPVVLLLLVPAVLRFIVELALRVMRRGALPAPLTGRDVGRTVVWMFVTWIAFGVGTIVMAAPLLEQGGPWRLAAAAFGAFALAHVVGVAIVPLPAGVGAREVILAIVLAPMIGATGATSLAIGLRVIHTVADLAMAVLVRRRRAGTPRGDAPVR